MKNIKKNFKNAIIGLIIFLPLTAAAQMMPDFPSSDIRDIVPDKDWMELYCLEARVRTGEAVARLEALEELVSPLIDEVENFVEVFNPPGLNYDNIIGGLEHNTEEVCRATTMELTFDKIIFLIKSGQDLRRFFDTEFRLEITNAFEREGDRLRAMVEKFAEEEVEYLWTGIESRLQAEANEETLIAERIIEQQEVPRLEAELLQEATREVAVRAEAGEFGQNPNMIRLQEIGAQLVQDRLPARIDALRAQERRRLEEKYARLVREEEERITAEIAEELGNDFAEIRNGLMALGEKFRGLDEKVDRRAAEIARSLDSLREQAREKKAEILRATLGAQINERIRDVEEYRDEIENARGEGENIPPTDELITRLETIREDMIDQFSSGSISIDNLRRTGANISIRCDAVRVSVARAKPQAGAVNAYSDLQKRLNDFGYNEKRLKETSTFLTKYQDFEGEAETSNGKSALQKAVAAEKQLVSVLDEFNSYSPESSPGAVADYRDRLVAALSEYKKQNNDFEITYPNGVK